MKLIDRNSGTFLWPMVSLFCCMLQGPTTGISRRTRLVSTCTSSISDLGARCSREGTWHNVVTAWTMLGGVRRPFVNVEETTWGVHAVVRDGDTTQWKLTWWATLLHRTTAHCWLHDPPFDFSQGRVVMLLASYCILFDLLIIISSFVECQIFVTVASGVGLG